jgi:hypothetical protein
MPEHEAGIVQIYSEKKLADNRFKSPQPKVNGNCTGAVSQAWACRVSAADKTDWSQGQALNSERGPATADDERFLSSPPVLKI